MLPINFLKPATAKVSLLKDKLNQAYLKLSLVIICLAIIGLSTVNHYGATWDEWIEIYMVRWVREYINEGKPIERDSEYYGFIFNYAADQLYDLSKNTGLFKSDQQFNSLDEHNQNNIKLKRKIQVKHIFTFVFSLVTYISVAGIVARLVGWESAWFAPIVLALFPHFWGHSFFNPKDIPFAAMFTLSTWLGACLLNYYYHVEQEDLKLGMNKITLYSLLYGSLVGLFTGIRVGGFFILFFLLAAHLSTQLSFKNIYLKICKFYQFYLLIILAWFVITTLSYPASWSNPVKWFFEALENFSKYSLWDNSVLFEGQFIPGKSLPWYYLPRILNITVPIIFQLSFLIGVIWIISKYRKFTQSQRACTILVLLQVVFLPTVAIIKQSTMYDGMRHFLFILPGIAAISAITFIWVYQIIKNKYLKIFALTLLIIQLSLIVIDMWAVHPYQYSYFNRTYGGLPAAYHKQETDYWGLSLKEGMEWLNKNAKPQSTIVVAGPTFVTEIFANPNQDFKLIHRDEFHRGQNPDPNYYIGLPRYDYHQAFPECPIVYSVTRQNTPLTIIKNVNKMAEEFKTMLDHLPKINSLSLDNYRIAVLLPCRNEGLTIARVVSEFRQALPEAEIYVYNNRSTDDTVEQAESSGAIVCHELLPGKGNVVRRMFADIDADIYVLADGDNTYEVSAVRRLIERLLTERLDMVVGARRVAANTPKAYRPGHQMGNRFLTGFVQFLFGARLVDMLSGYRVFSRRFVKSFPALSNGFETETELTIHALELKIPFAEEPTVYGSRPPGSESKLRTFTDGWRVLGTALLLFKEIRPFLFFSIVSFLLAFVAITLSIPIFINYLETGLVPRFPTAILSASIMLLAFLSLTCGMILDSVARGRREVKRMAYLSYSLAELVTKN